MPRTRSDPRSFDLTFPVSEVRLQRSRRTNSATSTAKRSVPAVQTSGLGTFPRGAMPENVLSKLTKRLRSVNEPTEMTFLKLLSNRRRPSILFHYTSANGLLGILQERGIWATDIRYLNDSSEYYYALDLLGDAIERRREKAKSKYLGALLEVLNLRLEKEDETEIFVSSFTEESDQLSQWRAYCAPYGGYAIGFKSKLLASAAAASWIVPCQYNIISQQNLVEKLLDLVIGTAEEEMRDQDRDRVYKDAYRMFGRLVHLLAPALKDPSFAEEREWRLVLPGDSMQVLPKFRLSGALLIPYHLHSLGSVGEALPVAALKVGPAPHEELAVGATRTLLVSNGLSAAMVEASEIPYRSW